MPFLYSGGTLQDLGTLGGADSIAYGINNNGPVVGSSYALMGQSAFIFSGGSMQNLNSTATAPGMEPVIRKFNK